MKILHCCLAAFYIDNYSYQENILPRMHRLQGHNVAILASTETFLANTELGYLKPSSYYTKDGIPVTRLPYTKWLPHFMAKKLRIYTGIREALESFKPDIIFLHDLQFISIRDIVSYAKKQNGTIIYVDCHTDYINSARNWISRRILHGLIYKWCARKIEPYTTKFYGVLPLRVDFLRNVYDIAEEKVELLVLGADDGILDLAKKDELREIVRESLSLKREDFVLITGGKIDSRKNIHLLMRAVNDLEIPHLKLIVFGTPNQQMKCEIDTLKTSVSIRYIGWIPSEKVYEFFFAADLGFFPGTHSVLWEQAIGAGLPCVFKRWDGIEHVDVGGNCMFLDSGDLEEIKERISLLYEDNVLMANMRKAAQEKGVPAFSYYQIAKRAIEG